MIKENLINVKSELPKNVTLVAVSKTKPNDLILEAYATGHKDFGENRVQELQTKVQELPEDIRWHFIGHLQRNKVKYIAPFVYLIHGVDSYKLLKEVNKQAKKHDRIISVLLQFHIAEEDTKFGFDFDEAKEMLSSESFIELQHISIKGVMGMATFTDDKEQVRREFKNLNDYFMVLKSHFFKFNDDFSIVSMGMSGDYTIAIEEGSNMVRVGSAIFGERN